MIFFRRYKKYISYLLLFLLNFFITFSFSCFFSNVSGDEVWNYGFSYNILQGLIPYRDFNMVITPLYSFLGSIFLKIFGNYLFSLHILDSILIGIMMIMLFRMIKWNAFLIYPVLIFYPVPSYNLLCLFWFFVILSLIHDGKEHNIIIGFLLGMLFLTKQNIGLFLFIIYFFYSKEKLKSIVSFLIPILVFLVYLIYFGAFSSFINYCFLGLLDFGEKNSNFVSYVFLGLEILLIFYLVYKLAKSHFQDKEVIYILGFQIFLYPIMDFYHFLVCFSPVLYLFLRDNKIISWVSVLLGFIMIIWSFNYFNDRQIYYKNNFLYLRNESVLDFSELELTYFKYQELSDYQFFCFTNNYFYKLYMNIPITKYDLLNDGNMGYHGGERYVDEIDNMCSRGRCVFFIDENMYDSEDTQFSKEIFDYVVNHYSKVEEYRAFSVYKN